MDKTVNQQIADAMAQVAENLNKAAAVPNATRLHGNGGLLSGQGIERDVLTAMIRPQGIGSVLPLIPSVYENPSFATILGIQEDSSERPTEPCADAPAGYLKGAELTAAFGLVRKDTRTIDIYKTMLQKNRGDMTDLILRGRLLGDSNLAPGGLDESGAIEIMTKSEMVNAGVRAERTLSVDLWRGTGTAPQFRGLDTLIATGLADWRTGALAPALDSDVKDFGSDLIDGNGRDIVEYLSAMEFYLRSNAANMGLDPVNWVVVMRPELWFELSAVWPCRYLSTKCSNNAGTNISVINDNVNVGMRDAMRNGMYIDINGNRYAVITDTGILESTVDGSGEYTSSLYFLPLTINQSFPVTYREYLDYRAAGPDLALLRGTQSFWTDTGIYGWSITDEKGWCYQLHLRTEQRIILRTPQLAGKIQNIKYAPLQHIRTPYPGDTYFKDGGVSMRSSDTIYWTERQ